MKTMYSVTASLPGGMTYIQPSEQAAQDIKIELKRRFPGITFYTSKTNNFGLVTYDKPKFPGQGK